MSLASGVSGVANAQDIDEIIVTARRVEEPLQDVPISITVFSQQELTNRNVVSANDLATFTPSLQANSRFGSESSSYAIRGFVQEGQTAPSVAVYFADVTAPRAQGGTTAGNGAGVGQFFDLQNIQVLKGPQGTLFGVNTTGGAVLLVPQKPTHNTEGYVEASAGNYDMKRGQAVVNVPVNDAVRFRIGIDSQKRDGFIHNKSGIGPDDFDDVNYTALRASLVVDLTPNIENYLITTYSKSRTHGPSSVVVTARTGPNCSPGAPLSPFDIGPLYGPLVCSQQLARREAQDYGFYDTENNNPDAGQKITQWAAINTTTWKATDEVTLKNIISYAEFKQDQTFSLFGENVELVPGVPIGFVGVNRDPNTHNVSQYTFTEELQLQGRAFDSRLDYQGGIYYEYSGPINSLQGSLAPINLSCSGPQDLQCLNVLGFGFVNNSLSAYRFRNIGLYSQGTYHITDQFSVTAGLRYTMDKADGESQSRKYPFQPVPNEPGTPVCANPDIVGDATDPSICSLRVIEKSKKPTWLIDFDYKPIDSLLLYAKYARGYRQGGANVSNTFPNAFGPEKVDSYELGSKFTFDGAVRGFFNIAAFYNDFTNQQLAANLVPAVPTVAPSQAVVNAGKSRIQGIEVDAAITPITGLTFSAGYAYLDTKLKSYNAPLFPGFLPATSPSEIGGDLTFSPHHKLTVTGAYTLPLPETVGNVTFAATWTHTSSQIADTSTPIGVMPSTDLLNLNLNWNGIAGSTVDAQLFGTNVTQEKYPVAVGGSWNSAGFDSYILGQPRMYGLRVKYRFGGQ